MKYYYLNDNQQSNGDYEVHAEGCSFMPLLANRTYLGLFSNCKDAVAEAKRKYPFRYRINGCYYCCSPCHTT